MSKPNQPVQWKQGWYTIGGQKHFFRSHWEVDFACYLEILKKSKNIKEWEYEPYCFWFNEIKRGVRSYLPDFRVTENDGSQHYIEVKGYFDKKSLTKLKRLKKYYPEVELRMVKADQIKEIRMKFGSLLQRQIDV